MGKESKEYEMNMSGEKEMGMLLPKGWRNFEILTCVEDLSKAGNKMFKIEIADVETGNRENIYPIATQGKRWYLKQLLTACSIAAGQDGVYKWDIADIIGKIVYGQVAHYEDEWINRENQKVVTTKHKITRFEALPPPGKEKPKEEAPF